MIAGSRNFNDYPLLYNTVTYELTKRGITSDTHKIIIISGKAKGADTLGEKYAKENNYIVEEYPAQWNNLSVTPCNVKYNKYGKPYNSLAGMNRNIDMVNASDLIIMFHDGISSGTAHDLELCKKYNKDYVYTNYDRNNIQTGMKEKK